METQELAAMRPNLAHRPDHVPAELVRNFNLYDVPGASEDVQAAFSQVQRSLPEIFWTPHNGGHWVVTGGEDVLAIIRDHERFSTKGFVIPPLENPIRQVPLELDPPEHTGFRRPLSLALTPAIIAKLEDAVRAVAITTIDALQPNGGCEFIGAFAKVLPIHVFLEMVELPLSDAPYLLGLAEGAVRAAEDHGRSHRLMHEYLLKWVSARREAPGQDLLSKLVNAQIGGQRISENDALGFATLVLFGGLDTVASMLGMIALFLAQHPEHRKRLIAQLDDEAFLRSAIEELIRRFGLANTARLVMCDLEFKGIVFKAGDRLLPANLFVGLDERLNSDPLLVDFDRRKSVHASFGSGPHICPGAGLARREILVFLQEWLRRIPEFRIKEGTHPVLATGMVNGVTKLELAWA